MYFQTIHLVDSNAFDLIVVKHVFPCGQGHFTTGLLVRVVLGMLHLPGHFAGSALSLSNFSLSAPLTDCSEKCYHCDRKHDFLTL